jgi:hypothetical protein
MNRYIPLGVGVLLVAVATIVHGAMTLRWTGGTSEEVNAVAKRYDLIPKKLGDWVGEDTNMDEKQLVAAGGVNRISRRYRNIKTNQMVQVFMICGLARNTAVHTPDICYIGQGFKIDRAPHVVEVGNTKAKAYVATFSKQTEQGPLHQRIFWLWNGGDGWRAPDSPRTQYRAWTPLNKLYLIASASDPEKAMAADGAELAQFASIFLPEVSRTLYPPVSSTAPDKMASK